MENEQEKYPLDDASISLFGEMKQQMNSINEQFRGALALFMRQHNLQGTWRISENGRELEAVKTIQEMKPLEEPK